MKRYFYRLKSLAIFLFLVALTGLVSFALYQEPPRVLVFSKTIAFRHSSIGAGKAAFMKMGREHNFVVDTTEDASKFNEENLKRYQAVVFLSTTGDVLNAEQQNNFERYIQAGGGYLGVHAAADTEYDWPWYVKLAGAWFDNHPMPDNVQKGTFVVVDKTNPATSFLPEHWEREDEFYAYKNISPDIKVLLKIDEKTYRGGTNGDNHPMAWFQEFDGGRAFYTAGGHTDASFSEPLFLQHLFAGLNYAMGGEKLKTLNYTQVRTPKMPEENRFTKVVLDEKLAEPMELTVLKDGRVLFIERGGKVKMYSPGTNQTKVIATIPVSTKYTDKEGKVTEGEDGLLGLTQDPQFEQNHWLYLYYSAAGSEAKNILTRYELRGDELIMDSKKVLLEVPTQREQCCHTGGSLAFDAQGNLYISTGDNTSPRATSYAPIDERPERSPWDAQKSSANTNDLRGKILRIHPESDGSYTIPAGNLFPKGTPKTRPEIYTMGHRNPYRISVDRKTGYVYWGEIGPDANDPSDQGPEGNDEVGQARQAGNFGWPYFVGNNKAYSKVNFTNNQAGAKFEAAKPLNTSPNNTGLNQLPPAQSAFIWYPYGASKEFPLVGSGGRSAMAGPVYYQDLFPQAKRAFPAYYNGKLFIYEWMRGWIMAVTLDKAGNYASMERFMPNYKFSNPVDLEFGPEGDMYMLEYGSGWFQANDDARLVRIEYNGGNRKPAVEIAANKLAGALPLAVNLSSKGTLDFDQDALQYNWKITSAAGTYKTFTQANPTINFTKPGVYKATLTVTDAKGEKSSKSLEIKAGNNPPVLAFDITQGNKSFFIPGKPLAYQVKVTDKEDGSLATGKINPAQVAVTIDYLPEGFDQAAIAPGHRDAEGSAQFATGLRLMESSDCKACHSIDKKSIGPAYKQVALKYQNDNGATERLAKKVISGGKGVWGEVPMSAHPQLALNDATEMVKYVLSLATEKTATKSLPVKGNYTPVLPTTDKGKGVYVLRASYRDQGANGIPGISAEQTRVLRNPNVLASSAKFTHSIQKLKLADPPLDLVIVSGSGAHIGFEQLDLSGIQELTFVVMAPKEQVNAAGGIIEVHQDLPTGKLLGTSKEIVPTTTPVMSTPPQFITVPLTTTTNLQDLYFVFKNSKAPAGQSLFVVTNVIFKAKENETKAPVNAVGQTKN
ncbi:ThuA domain-containing protein [Adhaeribacter radiodurans]|uniref:ThuA domain-containing protein n=1 Tax=Adhaeribacter radiodurans TaxID=2745197 RepID=A0A7L7LB47_9BACT|nr:ThuA domain-containing protein [Adhaeribacter radiodurans]QMU29944.1 ThuA domain-containing protein [Adhaeribacter radiodurans]